MTTLTIMHENSPNCRPRKNGLKPVFLVLHYTEINETDTHARFMNAQDDVSSHYVVATDGRVIQYVDETMRAWHAGVSYWNGVTDINSASIGIEIVNAGAPANYPAFNATQMKSVIELCRDILSRHPDIISAHILGHSDIAPDRKLDPGPAFDWELLAQNGIGVMPQDDDGSIPDLATVDTYLTVIGYNPHLDVTLKLRAFAAHYDRAHWNESGDISPVTLRKVRAMTKMIRT